MAARTVSSACSKLASILRSSSPTSMLPLPVAAAQSARDTAQSRAINARSEFHSLASEAVSISDPDRARRLGQDLGKFGEQWENLNDTVRSAQKDLDKVSKKQRKAQASVDKAQANVDRGRAMMADAERLSQARS